MRLTTQRSATRGALVVGVVTAVAALVLPRLGLGVPLLNVVLLGVVAGVATYVVQTRGV